MKKICLLLLTLCLLTSVAWRGRAAAPAPVWQYARYELNGNLDEILDVPADWGTPKAYPDQARMRSMEENGYIFVVGTDLNAEDKTQSKIRCVAISGVVIIHNISDFE